MDVMAETRNVRLAASKARDLAAKIRGMRVAGALGVVQLSERKGAKAIAKTLKSAIANAEHNARLSVDDLTVKDARVDEGPRMKRYWPRSRGMARPILRRLCHVRVVLTDGKSDAAV